MGSTTMNGFPWPLVPGLIGFGIAFLIQLRLKHDIDRDKVMLVENLAELYPNSIPPRKLLTARGQQLYHWFYIGGGLFAVSVALCLLFYAKPEATRTNGKPADPAAAAGGGPSSTARSPR